MDKTRRTGLGVGLTVSGLLAGQAGAVAVPTWVDQASAEPGFVQNQLEVLTPLDWISTQLRVELSTGSLFYVTLGVVPSLDPTLLTGAIANPSRTFPAGGNPGDALNSQILGLELVPNVGTGGAGGLGGSDAAVIDLDTFDLTYFGPPNQTDDIALVTPLMLAQMTASDDAFGTWALRLNTADPNDPQNQPAEPVFAEGFVFRGVFYNAPIPGDTDNDGDIDDSDLGTSFANYTGPVGGAGGKSLSDGDTDGDGDVDDSDLGTSFANYSGPLASVAIAVPEPSGLLLISMGAGAFLMRRRRFSRSKEDKKQFCTMM